MVKTRIVLVMILFLLLSSCDCVPVLREYVLIEKIQEPPTSGLCIKVGELWLPASGGNCIGMIESVPEKFYLHWQSDVDEYRVEVNPSEFFSIKEGDKKTVEKQVCKQ